MAGLWSVVAEAVVRACLTSIGIVRVLLRRLGLPRALCEDIGLVIEDSAANVRPIIRETSRLPQSYLIAVGANRKKCTSTAGRVSRSATAFNFCI